MCNNKIWFVPFTILVPSGGAVMNRKERAFPIHTIIGVEKEGDKTYISLPNGVYIEIDEDYQEAVTRLNSYNNY
jgi:hypothetical protein